MVVATISLVVALGGTSYAAATALAPNSVGTVQIKDGAVTPRKLAAIWRPATLFDQSTQPFSNVTLGHVGSWTIKASCLKTGGTTHLSVTASGPADTLGDGALDGPAYSSDGSTVALVPSLAVSSGFGYHTSDMTLHSTAHGSAHISVFAYAQSPSSSFLCKVNGIGYSAWVQSG
jgi:hypothetical protein